MLQRAFIAAALCGVAASCYGLSGTTPTTSPTTPETKASTPASSTDSAPVVASGEPTDTAASPTSPSTPSPPTPTTRPTPKPAPVATASGPAPSPAATRPKPVPAVEPFATLIRDKHQGRADVVKTELAWLAATSAAFDTAWASYAARKRVVDAAVAKAEQLSEAGTHAEARTILEGVITPVRGSEAGELPKARKVIEARDAELPAVFALARVTQAQGDWLAFVSLASDLYVRRRVLDIDNERKWFVTAADPKRVSQLAAGHTTQTNDTIRELRACAHEASHDGTTLVGRFKDTVWQEIEHGEVSFHKPRNTKGAWVLMKVTPTAIDDSKIAFKRTDRWVEEYDCKTTNRIKSYDPIFKKFHYEMSCKTRNKSQLITLDGAFAEAPPAWSTAPKKKITILGKIAKPGPSWSLTDVRVVDDRFIAFVPSILSLDDGGRCSALAPPKP